MQEHSGDGDRPTRMAVAHDASIGVPERRILTILFCDAADSTAMLTTRDPEDAFRDQLNFLTACATIITAHQGTVIRFMGDGLLAYFGYPQPGEGDAARAIHAALALCAEDGGPARSGLQPRCGIASGPVAIGQISAGASAVEMMAAGSTAHLAARLEQTADPGTVCVSEATRLLAQDAFVFTSVSNRSLRGFSPDEPVWKAEYKVRQTRRAQLPSVNTYEHEASSALEGGRAALACRNYDEASILLHKSLAAAMLMENSIRRLTLESDACAALVEVLQITHGYAAVETEAVRARLARTSAPLVSVRERFDQTAQGWMAASSSGAYARAAGLAFRGLVRAEDLGDPALLGMAHMMVMTTEYRSGRLMGAADAFAKGRPFFSAQGFINRPGAAAQTYGNAGVLHWLLGDESAVSSSTERLLTHITEHPGTYNAAFAMAMTAMHMALNQQWGEAATWAAKAESLAQTHAYTQMHPIAGVIHGYALHGIGQGEKGLSLMRAHLATILAANARSGLSMYLTWLAEVEAGQDDPDKALARIDEAMRINSEEMFYRAETFLVAARVYQQTANHEKAKAAQIAAETLARAMGAEGTLARCAVLGGSLFQ